MAIISFGIENTRLSIGADSQFKLRSFARGKRFELRVGKLEASVGRQRRFQPMVIVTSHAEARVLGTPFTLTTDTNTTWLEVTEGQVKFTRASDGRSLKVGAGTHAAAPAGRQWSALPRTGRILHEYWTNVAGASDPTWNVALAEHPTGVEYLPLFEAQTQPVTKWAERFRGYLQPPKTGVYTFWIAGDGMAKFLLSRDDQPENRVWLATANETSKAPREWTNQPKQQSSTLQLTAGRMYYIEAIQFDCGTGEHHLAVAWQGPDREREVIPGEFLSPFETRTKEKK